MNPLTDLLFTITWFVLLIWAFRTMARGWNMQGQEPEPNKINLSHPEMQDLKEGDELLVVNFSEPEPQDPLYKSMQDRIDTLRQEVDEEDDDDDNDGAVPARLVGAPK